MNRRLILSVLCLGSLGAHLWGAETPGATPAATPAPAAAPTTSNGDLQELRARIAEQQEQIKHLQQAVDEQQKLLERSLQNAAAASSPSSTTTSDGTPVVAANNVHPVKLVPALGLGGTPNPRAIPAPQDSKPSGDSNPCETTPEDKTPPYLRLGNVCIAPVGFMDLTAVWRDKNAGSGIGSSFGSAPYNNTVNAQNSEFRFSPQNSRIGFRIDGDWKGTHFIGYNEFDFLGTGGATNYTVTNGAFVPRIRLFWVDARKGRFEFLAGQSWSMLTPNRKGISALPGDLFYSQVIDVNYMAGLTWTRQPGMRVLFHPNKTVTAGISFENPDQYIGGSSGGGGITLPAALTSLAGTQLDNAPNISTGTNTVLATPTVHPDIIAKIAFDPTSRFHAEIAGIERTFKIWNPNAPPAVGGHQYSTTAGGGLQVGLNVAVVKNLRLITTNYLSDGGGRYLFGQVPDVIVRADGSLSTVHASGTVDGFEATIKNTLLYAYYGGIFIGRDVARDLNGGLIGFGYSGSPNSQNRTINEVTFGFNHTIWKDPRYGAINTMGQYEYLTRDPWSVAIGSPKNTHDNTIYFNIRYTLPGSMPNF